MVENKNIMMGSLPQPWGIGNTKTVTLSITEDCNLACKYCYMTGKNDKKRMSIETAKKVVDYILTTADESSEDSIVWEFIGGEPFLEIDLIDKISDYIKYKMYNLGSKWFNAYRFSISTNGLLYNTTKVQNYMKKNKTHLSVGISIDGNKTKHNLQRVYPNGIGSYDDVIKNVPLWLKQFPNATTKATFAKDDLPHLKDSIICLWQLGIRNVAANIVYENVWDVGDDIIFERQLNELADYIIENKLWENYTVRFFDPNMGLPLDEEEKSHNFCGSGKMIAVDTEGKFYPCIRFLDFCLNKKKGLCVGNVDDGINEDRLRPFHGLTYENQSNKECLECDIASGCSWCTGYNYDNSKNGSIYERSNDICKMQKANVRANDYFWNRLKEVIHKPTPRDEIKKRKERESLGKYLYFITSDNGVSHCNYKNWNNGTSIMKHEIFEKGMIFCKENGYIPVLLGKTPQFNIDNYTNVYIISEKCEENNNDIIVYNNSHIGKIKYCDICILKVSKNNLSQLSDNVKLLAKYNKRINIIIEDLEEWKNEDIDFYKLELNLLKDFIIETYRNDNRIELNILTDRLNINSMCNCNAGTESFALAPNGKIYVCPAFYFNNPEDYIGNIESGIISNETKLYNIENAPICKECDAYHCLRCKFLNKKLTNEINIPSKIQCVLSNIERNVSRDIQMTLINEEISDDSNYIKKIDYVDPLDKIINQWR